MLTGSSPTYIRARRDWRCSRWLRADGCQRRLPRPLPEELCAPLRRSRRPSLYTTFTPDYRFLARHRLGAMQVQSTWFPLIDRNPYIRTQHLDEILHFQRSTERITGRRRTRPKGGLGARRERRGPSVASRSLARSVESRRRWCRQARWLPSAQIPGRRSAPRDCSSRSPRPLPD